MGIVDDLAAQNAAAIEKERAPAAATATPTLAARIAADPIGMRNIEARLRAVAHNAVLEAMSIVGRDRLVDEDARMANVIYTGLCTMKPADVHRDDLGLAPSAQSTTSLTMRRMETVVKTPPVKTIDDGRVPIEQVAGQAVAAALEPEAV